MEDPLLVSVCDRHKERPRKSFLRETDKSRGTHKECQEKRVNNSSRASSTVRICWQINSASLSNQSRVCSLHDSLIHRLGY